MEQEKNIWNKIGFDDQEESAYDLLKTQKDKLSEASKGLLKLDLEAVDSYLDTEPPKLVVVYKAFIVAPELSNYRVKLITVVEYYEKGRFPVDIYSHLDDKKERGIKKDDFINKISEILGRDVVKNKVKELYKLSKENKEAK